MSNSRLSYRYAKSILDLAVERNSLSAVAADMDILQRALQQRDLLLLMRSPIINADKKTTIVQKIFGSQLSTMTNSFLGIIIRKHREAYLPEIVAAFKAQCNQLSGVVTAKLTTAVPVDDQIVQEIKDLVLRETKKSAVDLQIKVDPFVMGGFILEYDDKLFDTSIQQKLQDLEMAFQENKYVRKF